MNLTYLCYGPTNIGNHWRVWKGIGQTPYYWAEMLFFTMSLWKMWHRPGRSGRCENKKAGHCPAFSPKSYHELNLLMLWQV
ncbi:MAG: hypothetical protein CR994_05100 [Maribacter sp.]|nr:MAG: hypothetical protein CR994_05100 [Maribacter sp.]